MGAFMLILQNFSDLLFHKAPPGGSFCYLSVTNKFQVLISVFLQITERGTSFKSVFINILICEWFNH